MNITDIINATELPESDKLKIINIINKKPCKKKLTPYNLFFRDARVKLSNRNLTNKEILGIISDDWRACKLNKEEYGQLTVDCDNENKYEVTKPFHYYSLYNRRRVELGNEMMSASQVTDLLKEQWLGFDMSEKRKWHRDSFL